MNNPRLSVESRKVVAGEDDDEVGHQQNENLHASTFDQESSESARNNKVEALRVLWSSLKRLSQQPKRPVGRRRSRIPASGSRHQMKHCHEDDLVPSVQAQNGKLANHPQAVEPRGHCGRREIPPPATRTTSRMIALSSMVALLGASMKQRIELPEVEKTIRDFADRRGPDTGVRTGWLSEWSQLVAQCTSPAEQTHSQFCSNSDPDLSSSTQRGAFRSYGPPDFNDQSGEVYEHFILQRRPELNEQLLDQTLTALASRETVNQLPGLSHPEAKAVSVSDADDAANVQSVTPEHIALNPASVPLSKATENDAFVHSDTLSVVVLSSSPDDHRWLARRLCNVVDDFSEEGQSTDAHELNLKVETGTTVRFVVWNSPLEMCSDEHEQEDFEMGALPAVQSLLFSSRASIYVLEWDLAGNASCLTDQELRSDITNRCLVHLDSIAKYSSDSAVLPVALIPESLSSAEINRRINSFHEILKDRVEEHNDKTGNRTVLHYLVDAPDGVPRVNRFGGATGIEQLQQRISDSVSIFQHIGKPVPSRAYVRVHNALTKLKQSHKLVKLGGVRASLGGDFSDVQIANALKSIANTNGYLYYGDRDKELSNYMVLDRRWLVSALACILRSDLRSNFRYEIDSTRASLLTDSYQEHRTVKALIGGLGSNCPLLSSSDARMLWRDIVSSKVLGGTHSSSPLENSAATDNAVFVFLERLLVYSGIFLPLQSDRDASPALLGQSLYFVPSLVPQDETPQELWTYKVTSATMTTLCHAWQFKQCVHGSFLETIAVQVLNHLHKFLNGELPSFKFPTQQCWESGATFKDLSVQVKFVFCLKSCMRIRIATEFSEEDVSAVDIFIVHEVVSNGRRYPWKERLVVSGKGPSGCRGQRLWSGGYRCILDAVRGCLSEIPSTDMQVICPECLAHSSPKRAGVWGFNNVLESRAKGDRTILCSRGHSVNTDLLCGTNTGNNENENTMPSDLVAAVSAEELSRCVVLVAIWNPDNQTITDWGSGFIVDHTLGLVVTAAHVLFEMRNANPQAFGKPLFDTERGRAVIAVSRDGDTEAAFRYFADVVLHTIYSLGDACVLRITSRLQTDVDRTKSVSAIDQPSHIIGTAQVPQERLSSLQMTTEVQLEEPVRIIGFNQGGEGIFEQGGHISLSVDVAFGKVCRKFESPLLLVEHHRNGNGAFAPNGEIVTTCSTTVGHSGGPCVNSEGKVIGILSRADPAERERCYLVPASNIKQLVLLARQVCSR